MGAEPDRREFMKSVILQAGILSINTRGKARNEPGRAPVVAFRISPAHWLSDDRLQELLTYFARHPGTVDELAFFTSETHPPLPLEKIAQRAERLQKVLPTVREHGMRAGVNVLSTMGHHEENLDHSLQAPWQRVMDLQGNICRGSFCPAQPELIDYARKLYTTIAQAGPDF